MALKSTIWTAPSFSFDTADQPTTWRDFYIRGIDYLETLSIDPREGRPRKDRMDPHKNDVYRGGQASTSNINRQ